MAALNVTYHEKWCRIWRLNTRILAIICTFPRSGPDKAVDSRKLRGLDSGFRGLGNSTEGAEV